MDTHAQECLDFPRIRELLASHALTGLGKSLATQIQPITRPQMVQRWLTQVEELRRLAEDRGLPPFGGITDVRDVVKRSGPPLRISADEMAALGDALAATGALVRHFDNLPEGYPELAHLAGRIGNFESVANRIRSIVDARGEVRDDASPKLQRLRRDVDNARKEINAAVERLLRDQNIRRILQYPKPTVHGDRIVLPLRTEYRGRLPGVIHRTSDSGATAYVRLVVE